MQGAKYGEAIDALISQFVIGEIENCVVQAFEKTGCYLGAPVRFAVIDDTGGVDPAVNEVKLSLERFTSIIEN